MEYVIPPAKGESFQFSYFDRGVCHWIPCSPNPNSKLRGLQISIPNKIRYLGNCENSSTSQLPNSCRSTKFQKSSVSPVVVAYV